MSEAAPSQRRGRFRLHDLEIDLDKQTVRRRSQAIALPELSFRLLAVLLRHAPDTISKDDLIREVVVLYQQGDSSLGFELDLCPGPDGLAADSGRLRQMLHNLIRNSQEAGKDGPRLISITSKCVKQGKAQRLNLELLDDGPGFPKLVLDQPFEPYVSNKASGSGLGLAICRKIISEHNGSIAIENPPQGGAKVIISLPLALE